MFSTPSDVLDLDIHNDIMFCEAINDFSLPYLIICVNNILNGVHT